MDERSDKTESEDQIAESRRDFLKKAGVAGLGAGAVSVAGAAPVGAALGAEAKASDGWVVVPPDNSREDLGGSPIFDDQRAFETPLLRPLKQRVLALKQLLIDKGIMQESLLNVFVQYYSEQVGPYIGKAVVAHAWVDPAFKDALLNPENPKFKPYSDYPSDKKGPFSATLYIKDYLDQAAKNNQLNFEWPPKLGLFSQTLGPEGEFLRVVANGPDQTGKVMHNLVVCTLCSCYPQALLGVQPEWYKSRQYRARSISAPRGVLLEFADSNGDRQEVEAYLQKVDEVRVWDSNSEVRFLVIPEPPKGADLKPGNERNLANLITRNGMIGTQLV
jgi:nitrile hydratase